MQKQQKQKSRCFEQDNLLPDWLMCIYTIQTGRWYISHWMYFTHYIFLYFLFCVKATSGAKRPHLVHYLPGWILQIPSHCACILKNIAKSRPDHLSGNSTNIANLTYVSGNPLWLSINIILLVMSIQIYLWSVSFEVIVIFVFQVLPKWINIERGPYFYILLPFFHLPF